MSTSLDIRFLDSQTLGESCGAEQVVEVFSDLGFAMVEFTVDGRSIKWPDEPSARGHVLNSADKVQSFAFVAWHRGRNLEVHQQVVWDLPRGGHGRLAWIVTRTDNTPYFWLAEYDPVAYSRFFLDIGKELYALLRPSFGFVDFDYGMRTTHEDIESRALPTIYWANFFGLPYVTRIGRDQILSAPAFRTDSLVDGGLLYVLSSCPGLSQDHVSTAEVSTHFGGANVR